MTTGIAIHWTRALSLMGFALAWFLTTAKAFRFILFRRINLTGNGSSEAMWSFLLFRWFNIISVFVETGNFTERGSTMIRVSWGIPLFITEIILQWNKK